MHKIHYGRSTPAYIATVCETMKIPPRLHNFMQTTAKQWTRARGWHGRSAKSQKTSARCNMRKINSSQWAKRHFLQSCRMIPVAQCRKYMTLPCQWYASSYPACHNTSLDLTRISLHAWLTSICMVCTGVRLGHRQSSKGMYQRGANIQQATSDCITPTAKTA